MLYSRRISGAADGWRARDPCDSRKRDPCTAQDDVVREGREKHYQRVEFTPFDASATEVPVAQIFSRRLYRRLAEGRISCSTILPLLGSVWKPNDLATTQFSPAI